MASEWPNTTIGEHVDLITGEAFQSARFETAPSDGVRLARGDNVKEGEFEWGEKSRFWPELTPDLERYLLIEGDVLLGMDGSKVGKNWVRVRREDLPCLLVQRVARLRSKPTLHQSFLRYLIGNPMFRDYVGRVRTGTSIPHISGGQIKSYEFRLPPLPEQRAIASVLGALDDKIDLNRRMCQTLEEMARALFKSWFVDFDPVRAKMEGRDPGLPKEIAELFPSRLVDSELGPIPEGWRVASLRDEFEAAKGLSYKGSGLSDSGVPLHNLNSIFEGGGYKHSGIKWYRGEYADRHLIKGGDVIVANTEQGHDRLLIGFAARVPNDYDGLGLFSHHLYRLRAALGSQLTGNWIYRLLNTRAMHETVSGYANGTTVNMLPIDGLQSPRFVVPAGEIVATFDRQDEDWQARGALAIRETRTLAALRDTLLPKLISGELRVPASLGSMQEVST